MKTLSFKQLIKDPVSFMAFGFGSGLLKPAPGTWGTLSAVPLYLFVAGNPTLFYLVTVLSIVAGVYICSHASKQLGVHDHPGIVWDEIAGFFITMLAVPFTWLHLIFGFALFRFFDILKPWPIKWIDQKVSGGLGIMLDDVLAGLFAGTCLFFIHQNGF